MNREFLLNTLRQDEGYSPVAYKDNDGQTVGYGHNLLADGHISAEEKQMLLDGEVDPAEALVLLEKDLDEAIRNARQFVDGRFQSFDDNFQHTLVMIAFILGLNRMFLFRNMRLACIRGEREAAAHELLDSKWYREGSGGIKLRVERLARLLAGILDIEHLIDASWTNEVRLPKVEPIIPPRATVSTVGVSQPAKAKPVVTSNRKSVV